MLIYYSEKVWNSMKKIIVLFSVLMFLVNLYNNANAAERPLVANIQTTSRYLSQENYNFPKALKYYRPYEIVVVNENDYPVLVTSATQLVFTSADGTITPSKSRRNIYRTARKFDHSKHIPNLISFPWPVGFTLPWSTKSNVYFSKDLMTDKPLPLRFEPGQVYNIRVLAPVEIKPVSVNITNVTFDMQNFGDIKVPLESIEEL